MKKLSKVLALYYLQFNHVFFAVCGSKAEDDKSDKSDVSNEDTKDDANAG